jgi:predicted permease
MSLNNKERFSKPHLWIIHMIGVIVPRRLRADWRQEWEAELRYREELLADWERLDRRNKLDLLWHSLGAFMDALWLQPRRWEDEMFQDLRYGVRMLRTNKEFTAVAVLSLALGIGANTAIFSLINAVLLKTLPVKNPEQLVLLTIAHQRGTDESFSYPLYQQFRDRTQNFTGVFASGGINRLRMTVREPGDGGQIEAVQAEKVSGNFFSTLNINAINGRLMTDDDDRAGNPHQVAVISYEFWQRRFSLDPAVVGKTITLNDVPLTIIGVTPPGFYGFEVGRSPDLWWPMQMWPQIFPGSQALNQSNASGLRLMGGLRTGVSETQARAELDLVYQQHLAERAEARAARLGSRWTQTDRRNFLERRIELQSGSTGWTVLRKQFRQPLLILMTVVGLVLMIACANVANLLLARAAARQKEIAVRLALGAGRLRLIRQLVTESVLLAVLGGALGLLFANWGARLLLAYLPQQSNIALNLYPDARVLVFTVIVSMLTGILFGLAPALRATRLDLNSTLKENTGNVSISQSRLSLNKMLVVSQVALSLFLLIGAGLFVRTLQNLKGLDAGFDRDNVIMFSLDLGTEYNDAARRVNLYQQLLERLETLPGVQSGSLSSYGMLSDNNWSTRVTVQGYTSKPDENLSCYFQVVGPRFFETMGIPILLGRDFGSQDDRLIGNTASRNPNRVAIINQALGSYFFPNENPIGKRFSINSPDELIEIVGVVKDTKYQTLREETLRTIYLPFFQEFGNSITTFELRTFSQLSGMAETIKRTVQELDPKVQVLGLRTMNDVVDESLMRERFIAQLAGFFSLFSLLLAAIGLYGMMSYAVTCRTTEIGVRMALGARGRNIIRLVMRETMLLVIIGLILGLSMALATTRLIASLLFDMAPNDPLTIVLSSLLLLSIAGLAGYLPARRAARVDPIVALRNE